MQSPIRRYLPHIVIAVTVSLVMVVAYASVGMASLSAPKSLWSPNPDIITFSHTAGTGSITESVKCAPPVDNVVFQVETSNPSKIISQSIRQERAHVDQAQTLSR